MNTTMLNQRMLQKLIATIGLIFFLTHSTFSQNGIGIQLSLNKASYLESESIWAKIEVITDSSSFLRPQQLGSDFNFLHFVLMNARGDTIPDIGMIISYTGGVSDSTGSGSRRIWDLLDRFGIPEIPRSGYRSLFLPAGNYLLKAIIEPVDSLQQKRSRSVGESNSITFKIQKAEGDEKRVRDLYLASLTAFLVKYYDLQESHLLEIIKEHPTSVFVSRSVSSLLSIYNVIMNQDAKHDSLVLSFLHKYPQDPYISKLLPIAFMRILRDDSQRRSFATTFWDKNPTGLQARVLLKLGLDFGYYGLLPKELKNMYASQRGIVKPTSYVTLSGTVFDADRKQPIPKVLVVIITDRSGEKLSFSLSTNERGHYSCLIPGDVENRRAIIQINHNDYQPFEKNTWVGSDRTLDVPLAKKRTVF